MKVLELFSGIGGCAAALAGRAEVVAAVDTDRDALATYTAALSHRTVARNLDTPKPAWFEAFGADLWWWSPPCKPHTIRGRQDDLADPRSRSFRNVVAAIGAVRPPWVALENVPWFEGSDAHALLRDTLDRAGYAVAERTFCPTLLGVPNERRRFFLVAGPPDQLRPIEPRPAALRPLREFVGAEPDPALAIAPDLADRFGGALHVVDADDDHAVAACFTSAYGRSPVYAGSYLRERGAIRRFAPEEIARLLGLPATFPAALPIRRRWAQVGNSLSVPAVREVLRAIPALGGDAPAVRIHEKVHDGVKKIE